MINEYLNYICNSIIKLYASIKNGITYRIIKNETIHILIHYTVKNNKYIQINSNKNKISKVYIMS